MQSNHTNLVELLIDIVQKYPTRTALKDRFKTLTYLELYQRASALSKILYQHNIQKGEKVACISKKNVESIVCFWATLFAGGIPVLLDYEEGIKANQLKINEVQAEVILLDRTDIEYVEVLKSKILVDYTLKAVGKVSLEPIHLNSLPEICYILLTSGTTGIPKAVQVSHKNILHYTYSIYEKIGSPLNVMAAHVSTFAADLGFTNWVLALVSGGTLRILDKEESTDPAYFKAIVKEEKISLLKITPSHLSSLVSYTNFSSAVQIEHVIVGGEKLSWEAVKIFYASGICCNLYNHYGPTETTIGALVFEISPSSNYFGNTDSVPIGTPLGKTQCFLEGNSEAEIGELYITGPGVSIGYLKNESGSSSRFISKEIDGKWEICFRTGDICRKLKDGTFEFLYRTDKQVKIRGYRIELGEIELTLTEHPLVENAHLKVSTQNGRNTFDAYVKLINGKVLEKEVLRNWLAEQLPSYKIPTNFYFYEAAPFNSNGKIDLKALEETIQNAGNVIREYELGDEDEWHIAALNSWKNILNKNDILDSANFFEIGGDSLLAIQLIGRLQRLGYKLNIRDLNNHPIFFDFFALKPERLDADNNNENAKQRQIGLTLSQQLFLVQTMFDLNQYCQSIILESEKSIEIKEMAFAFHCLLKTHSQLTKVFFFEKNLSDEIDLCSDNDLGTTILEDNESHTTQIQRVVSRLLQKMSIQGGKVFIAHIFITPKGKNYIFIACHHLVVDVVSWNILIEELLEYYDQYLKGCIPKLHIENSLMQFYSGQQEKKRERIIIEEDTIVHRLPECTKVTETRSSVKVFTFVLPEPIANGIKKIDEKKHLFSQSGFLLSALGKTILDEYKLPIISIDVEFHGRPQEDGFPDLSRSIAWWATTMPVQIAKNNVSPQNCSELLNKRAEHANYVNLPKVRNVITPVKRSDIRFNHLGHFPEKYKNESIELTASPFNTGPTRSAQAQQEYQLFFTSRFIGSYLVIDLQYLSEKFSYNRIDNLVFSFFNNLKTYLQLDGKEDVILRLPLMESNLPTVGQPLYHLDVHRSGLKMATPKVIFLTGATGFLGIHLLGELIRNDGLFIYCLVRGKSQQEAAKRLQTVYTSYFKELNENFHKRVQVVQGDLTAKKFGLSEGEFEKLGKKIDIIVHSAADVNLLKKFSELKDINITATANIIEFAQRFKSKEIHYISTLAVSGWSASKEARNYSEESFEYGQFFVSDYEKTKHEAEKLIRNYIANGGEGKIYRVGHIAADSERGKFQQNIEQNRVFQIIKGVLLVKQIPDIYQEDVAFSYVDIVAKTIAMLSTNSSFTPMECLHVENSSRTPFTHIVTLLRKAGYSIEVVTMDQFLRSVAGFTGTTEDKNVVHLAQVWIQRAIDISRNVNYIHKDSVDALSKLGLYFPKVNQDWFKAMICNGIEVGFFPLPEHSQLMHFP